MALTEAEKQELARLEKDVGPIADKVAQAAPAGGLTPQEQQEMQALEGEVGHLAPEPEKPGLLSSVLHSKPVDMTLRALDYPGGYIRTGLAAGAGLLTGNNPVTSEDVKNTIKGKAPTSGEYLERMGVSEGPSVEVPFTDGKRVSLRDAEGLALDVGTDPFTAISRGVKALRPAGAAAEAGGEALYKSGLKKIDEKLVEKGAKEISDVLLEEGKTGTTKTLAKEAEKIGKQAAEERKALYQKAADKGVSIDMAFPMENAEAAIQKMASDPGLRPMAEKFSELLNSYKSAGKVSLEQLSEWKTNLYNALPDVAYDNFGKLKGPANEFKKALASDFKQSIVDAGNTAEKGLGDKIDKLNETMQSVIEARKPMKMQIRRANTPNLVSAVDAMLVGGGAMVHDPAVAMGILAAKKGVQAASTTAGRTMVGKGLMDVGKSGAPDALLRQGLIDQRRKKKGLLLAPGPLIPIGDKDAP